MLFHTFLFVFLAEMADKTQLMIMALTNRYSVKTVIAGMILGVFAISGVSVLAGDLIGDLIPMRLIKLAASAMFLFFGLMNLRCSTEENRKMLTHVIGGQRNGGKLRFITKLCDNKGKCN